VEEGAGGVMEVVGGEEVGMNVVGGEDRGVWEALVVS
jgi:hypothetical protein